MDMSEGEVNDGEGEPVIIGGMVLDIHATPSMPANPGTTTPGKVRYVLGGVARNVAECMSKLGTKPYMISALGLDMAGNILLEHWKSAGLWLKGIRRHQDIETPIVCNVFDIKGEVSAGVASVEAVEKYLLPEWIHRFNINIQSAPVVMVDANLIPPSLIASCRMAAEADIPVWFEPVSVTKSKRVVPIAEYITFVSPNEDELVAMANALSSNSTFAPIKKQNSSIKYSTESLFRMLRPPILVLLEKGIRVIIVTLGSDGVIVCSKGSFGLKRADQTRVSKYCGSKSELYKFVNSSCPENWFFGDSEDVGHSNLLAVHFPAIATSVISLTGAGDCLVGGTLASICAGLNIFQSLAVGIAAAKGAVEVAANVPAEYKLAKLADDARSVYFGSKVLFHQSML